MRIALKQIGQHPYWWLLVLLLILVRLPAINRPMSKHHEQNTAVVLINAISWQQAGGGNHFSFTPLLNFQGSANRVLDKGNHIDKKGNQVYLSFGTAWYVIPYFVFDSFNISPSPFNLRLLSLLIGLLTALLLAAALLEKTGHTKRSLLYTAAFCLLPAPLWYMGIGYVTTAIMMPLVVLMLSLWRKIANQPKSAGIIRPLVFSLLGMLLIQFDWYGVFLLVAAGLWSLGKIRTNKSNAWLPLCCLIAAPLGVVLVLAQFASYLGWEQVIGYWTSRFGERSMDTMQTSYVSMLLNCGKNLVTGYPPLLLLLFAAAIAIVKRKITSMPAWSIYAITATLFYNFVFLNWSAEHEFAWMALSLVLVFCMAISHFAYRKFYDYILAGTILLSLVQYFYINRPGAYSFKGLQYARQQQLGTSIAREVAPKAFIFTNLANDKVVEYYARRTFNNAADAKAAAYIADSLQLEHAVWLTIESLQIVENKQLHRQQKQPPPQ